MLKRPKPGDDEDDILRMQEEFLKEKSKNQNLRPSAAVINLRFKDTETGTRKQSKYATSKGLVSNVERPRTVTFGNSSVVGDILEKNVETQSNKSLENDDKVYFPSVIPSILGNIMEKNVEASHNFKYTPMPLKGFPIALKRDFKVISSNKSESLEIKEENILDTEMHVVGSSSSLNLKENINIDELTNLPSKSYIITSKDAEAIHSENLSVLNKMSKIEILEEQKKLLETLDPKLVRFLKSKRNSTKTVVDREYMDATDNSDVVVKKDDMFDDSLWENDVLSDPNISNWMHFNTLEKDKLEWIKGVQENKKIKPNEPYEARFDFGGYLLPYTLEYTEKTKTLFHHGEEPNRPGYSLTELFELARSAVTQQRVMALNCIAGVLEYYNLGTYKDIIEIPLSKIFFVIRIALDENKVVLLEPALKAMRNMVYNRIDEASLDALLSLEAGTVQPCLENDKSEIVELASKEDEFNDFHLAEIDIITTLLRTDILQRLHYIFGTVKPSFNSVQYSIHILIRLARDSIETSNKIIDADHLMTAILKYFVPTTSINFHFTPTIIYKEKPILSALKLLRVLSLQSKEIGIKLIEKYNIVQPLSEYITSGVDGSYGLRLQIESFCILSNLLHFNIGLEISHSLCPIVLTIIYKHVKGTDISPNSSVLSATHGAVVFQFVHRLLKSTLYDERFKCQIYPLIMEGTLKWLAQLCSDQYYTFGHLRLLCSALDCCRTMILLEKTPIISLNNSLKMLLKLNKVAQQIVSSSNLLSNLENKDLHSVKNLMSLNSLVIDSPQKVLPILNTLSVIPFYGSLFKLLEVVEDKEILSAFINGLADYFEKLVRHMPSLCDNWFTRIETDFMFSVVKVGIKINIPEPKKDILYVVANKLCYMLRVDKKYELDFLFGNIVFNKYWFTAERLMNLVSLSDADGFSKALSSIEDIKLCYSKIINLNYLDTGPNMKNWKGPILPRDWIYLPILNLYTGSQVIESTPSIIGEHANKLAKQKAAEKQFVISCSLEWILFNELCFSDLLHDIDVTDRYCRIMCVFLCDNTLFLDSKIKLLLRKCIQNLFKKEKNNTFKFDRQLTGLHNFQDFYTQFLEQFQSVSYGDYNFAACVLVPLAQKHDVKWRKLLWSEYAGCLRVLDCPEDMLCYKLDEYLYPEEKDESLINSYLQALSSNLLRPNTIAYKIAEHHAKLFMTKFSKKH